MGTGIIMKFSPIHPWPDLDSKLKMLTWRLDQSIDHPLTYYKLQEYTKVLSTAFFEQPPSMIFGNTFVAYVHYSAPVLTFSRYCPYFTLFSLR